MTQPKVELGERLFFDRALSFNRTQSCGTCHEPGRAFTDGLARSVGSTGQVHPRGSMGLINVAYAASLTWANPLLTRLEEQALLPLFAESPTVEMGFAGRESTLLERLRHDVSYMELFAQAFTSDADPVTVANVVRALAAYQRTLIAGDSAYDRYVQHGDRDAMTEGALRGMELFFSERLECFHCHGGFNFSASVNHDGLVEREQGFFNTGLYNVDGHGGYPPHNSGLMEVTTRPEDMGRFKPPSLRNVALTAPYMHDGSVATLGEVVDLYAAGGRLITGGPQRGDGRNSPLKSGLVSGFVITGEEREDLLSFLESLTDSRFSVRAHGESADEVGAKGTE